MKTLCVLATALVIFVTAAVAGESETKDILIETIALLQQGNPDYDNMEAVLRAAVKQQLPNVRRQLSALGDVVSVTYEGEQNGADVYGVEFENGANVWMIGLGPTGKISTLFFQ